MSIRQFHSLNRPPASSGSIGGTPFYIIAGQSNTGRALVGEMTSGEAAIYAPAITNAYTINAWRYFNDSQTSFLQLDAGTNTMLGNRFDDTEFGPETALAYQLQAYQSKNRYYLKWGIGGQALAGTWAAPSGFFYTQMLTGIESALASAAALGITDLRLHAFIWMQGEEDAINATNAANYQANLENFFSQFTTWWVTTKGKNANFKKVIGRIQDINAGFEEDVRAAQNNFCANPANNAILINTDSYTRKDYIHFDASSQIQFGIDIFNQVKDL